MTLRDKIEELLQRDVHFRKTREAYSKAILALFNEVIEEAFTKHKDLYGAQLYHDALKEATK